MTPPPHLDAKRLGLQGYGVVRPHPKTVTDPLFATSDFLDARDLVQTRYEMIRRVQVDGQAISCVATAFGVSRPTVYQTLAMFAAGGLPGLLPHRRGPRHGYKLRSEVVAFVIDARVADGAIPVPRLVQQVQERFGMRVHRRSIERVLTHPVKGGAVPTT